ncbi:MAG: low molecular weight protein arginine phosphatase [Clostridia bacterium]
MKRVLFVCTGNTCRSPMAEGIFNFFSQGAASRGLMAEEGNPASEKAVKAMEKMGIDITGHVSRQLTKEDVESADLILTMTKSHKDAILSAVADANVFTIGEYADGEDISDPYGKSQEVYDKCAKELYGYIEKIVEKLK